MQDFDIRPWGNYLVLSDKANHKVKRICVTPGKRLSLQRHQKRQEHWFIVEGKGIVTCSDKTIEVHAGDNVDIPLHAVHRIHNSGETELVFIEIQTGTYFGEDDIERIEDDFNRI